MQHTQMQGMQDQSMGESRCTKVSAGAVLCQGSHSTPPRSIAPIFTTPLYLSTTASTHTHTLYSYTHQSKRGMTTHRAAICIRWGAILGVCSVYGWALTHTQRCNSHVWVPGPHVQMQGVQAGSHSLKGQQ